MADPAVPSASATDQQFMVFTYRQRMAADDCRNRLTYVGKLQGSIR